MKSNSLEMQNLYFGNQLIPAWIISPAYFRNEDLIKEYQQLIANSDSEFSQNFTWEYHYRVLTLEAEIKLRNLIQIESLNLASINQLANQATQYSQKFISESYLQFKILKQNYNDQTSRRIATPRNTRELWMQHKYSIMARNVNLYKEIGRFVAQNNSYEHFPKLYLTLVNELRKKPKRNSILNVLQHLWGYISNFSNIPKNQIHQLDLHSFLIEIQKCVQLAQQKYLTNQIALSELEIWIYEG